MHTLKQDCASGAYRRDADTVLELVPIWITDYNAIAPHSPLAIALLQGSTERGARG